MKSAAQRGGDLLDFGAGHGIGFEGLGLLAVFQQLPGVPLRHGFFLTRPAGHFASGRLVIDDEDAGLQGRI
ncbi:hypothetical protein HHS34_006685 [Acidithiobacillus montserratensis]|uniref:Uncharacterized protein n=1 Tax=Acidithiobacillus montserratensis TaxID=2729135 RepID=A0ACD5HJZ2_9PROT|nr:hypothetical protein [Acidithiobacillus montserratensis]MBN2680641.1 hypothetical protein [Acidithiobacillaceae bacterium]MBU2748690.1 hypothetical protein [Acidithiobacillus montserratensis]